MHTLKVSTQFCHSFRKFLTSPSSHFQSFSSYLLLRLNVHSNLLQLIRDRGKWGDGYLCPTTYSLHCHHQNDCIKVGSCVRHFNVPLTVWAQSQDSVLKPQLLEKKESRSGSNRGLSAYQPSALPLGHTGSRSPEAIKEYLL